MASRRFFGYHPWDYYHTTPYPYYYHKPAAMPEPRPSSRPVPVSIPVHFVGAEEPKKPVLSPEEPKKMEAAGPKKRVMAAEEAAVRIQAAARGFLARRMVRVVRAVEREAEEVAQRVTAEAAELAGDERARVGVAEELMRLLFRLDAVRGAREYRRRVTRKVLALQDAVDDLEQKAPEVAAVTAEVADAVADGTEVTDVDTETVMESAESGEPVPEMVIESAEVAEVADAVVGTEAATDADTVEMGTEPVESVPETVMDSEEPVPEMVLKSVESARTEACAELDAKKAMDDSKSVESEGDSEVAMEEVVAGDATASWSSAEVKQELEVKKVADDANRLDAKKVMEMVAVLCERSAQQCAVIGALAQRVDSLERAVRRMEADKRKRKQKKMSKGSKKSMRSCYSD